MILHTQTGAVIATLTSSLNEGEPIGMDVTSNFLTIFTMEGFLKIFDVSKSEPKLITPTKAMYDLVGDFGEIIQAKMNASGNKVALTIAAANLVPDGGLYIYDIENNNLFTQNFRDNKQEKNEFDEDIELNKNIICQNRIPINFFWDRNDPRLLICDARKLKSLEPKNKRLVRSKSNTGKFYNEFSH